VPPFDGISNCTSSTASKALRSRGGRFACCAVVAAACLGSVFVFLPAIQAHSDQNQTDQKVSDQDAARKAYADKVAGHYNFAFGNGKIWYQAMERWKEIPSSSQMLFCRQAIADIAIRKHITSGDKRSIPTPSERRSIAPALIFLSIPRESSSQDIAIVVTIRSQCCLVGSRRIRWWTVGSTRMG